MIRAVIFDMYETLVTLMRAPQCNSAEMAALAGAEPEAFRRVWRGTEDDRMLGRRTFASALRLSMEESGVWSQPVFERIVRLRGRSREILPETLHPQILPMLSALRDRGMRMGLISNCQSEEVAAIRRSALMPYFDVSVLSFEVGLMKPDPAIFRRCTAALNVPEEACLYVGDGGSHELEAARQLGMRTVQAVWYLQEGSTQPCGRMPGFPQAGTPMDILQYIDE